MKSFFLITPFQSDPDFEFKKTIIIQLAKQHSLQFLMADEELVKSDRYASGSLEMILGVDFVIADLSYERPSCYYELGYLQAMKKKVHLIATQNTTIHQLLTPERIVFYSDIVNYEEVIREILKMECE